MQAARREKGMVIKKGPVIWVQGFEVFEVVELDDISGMYVFILR